MAGRKAVIVLLGACLFFAGIGYIYLSRQASNRPIDGTTFCPTDAKGPNSVTAILIDRTDPFNATQMAALRDRLNDLKDHLVKYDLLEIYTVEPTEEKLLKPAFAMCSPGKGDEISIWTGNQRLVEERWQKFFDQPLQALFGSILETEDAQISPIMESIQSIVVTSLGTQKIVAGHVPRRLVVISDLIQYVDGYSQYRPLSSFGHFKAQPYYQEVRADLSGIDVDIWYIRRKKTLHLQGDKHIEFWRAYLTDQGATIDQFWNVPGI